MLFLIHIIRNSIFVDVSVLKYELSLEDFQCRYE